MFAQSDKTTDILRNESWLKTGPAVGPVAVWHNFRQHETASDISVGVSGTWDIMLAQPLPGWYVLFRPGLSVLYPTVMIDAVFRLRLPIPVSLIVGGSFDPTWERDFPKDSNHPEWQYVREVDPADKRLFVLMGFQVATDFAFYELQYRIQIEKGARAYYHYSDGRPPEPTGVRRYFLLSVGMGIRL
ncbi:MAG: hypothetical protein JXA28_11175 [Bacteroidetes bacterium]|nr:hypothetical protein [Bacteroidota bacterium]